jgi:xanthine dehydrogenase accessory factor
MHQQLQRQLDNARQRRHSLVQIRVLKTQGSSYRKSGARMLIDELGQHYDIVSGGCIETHLARQAMEIFRHGMPKILEYDFSDPDAPEWQISVGCRGKVTLLLERLGPDNHYASLALYLEGRLRRQPSWLITQITNGQSELRDCQTPTDTDTVVEFIEPAPRLLLIGTGADTDAIIELAQNLDYQVQVVGCQSLTLHRFQHRFPNLAQSVVPQQLDNYLVQHPVDYAVVMTHNQSLDAAYLSQASLAQLALVGMLGPLDRKHRVLDEMTSPAPVHLAAPMGLSLGGHGSQAVALSVMSQVQAVHHHMQAQPLSRKH